MGANSQRASERAIEAEERDLKAHGLKRPRPPTGDLGQLTDAIATVATRTEVLGARATSAEKRLDAIEAALRASHAKTEPPAPSSGTGGGGRAPR